MEHERVQRRAPVGRANRFFILACATVVSPVVFVSLLRALGLPGVASLGPVMGTVMFIDWLTSDRHAVSATRWGSLTISAFLLYPAAVVLCLWLME